MKAGGEVQSLRLAERFGFAVTDEDEAEEAGLSEAALAFDLDSPFRFDGRARPVAVLGLRAGHLAGDAGADAGGRPALRSHDACCCRASSGARAWARRSPRRRARRCAPRSAASTSRRSPSTCCSPRRPRRARCRRSSTRTAMTTRKTAVRARAAPTSSPSGNGPSRPASNIGSAAALRLDVAYWQRHVDEYADPNVFFGTTIVFPNAVAEGRARGVDARLEFAPGGAWSGYANVSVGKVTQVGPITGGVFLEDDVADIGPGVEFTPDHDQRVVGSGGLTWTGSRGASVSVVGRYESGTPIELDEDEARRTGVAARRRSRRLRRGARASRARRVAARDACRLWQDRARRRQPARRRSSTCSTRATPTTSATRSAAPTSAPRAPRPSRSASRRGRVGSHGGAESRRPSSNSASRRSGTRNIPSPSRPARR